MRFRELERHDTETPHLAHRPGGSGNPDRSNIMKYRLADLHNGPFGDVYENLSDAEKALEEAIAEGQAINDECVQECAGAGREVPSAADFFSIVEVESVYGD